MEEESGSPGVTCTSGVPGLAVFLLWTWRGSTVGFVGHAGDARNGALLSPLVSDEVICKPRHLQSSVRGFSLLVKACESWKEF